ncbi:MAG: hypothetical protein RDU20_02450 [Desulfomonilaceae bacterium]|nr:hypothetical protein [Desulfomonilaceae bacterium]
MKFLVFPGLVILLVLSSLGLSAAKMYWDRSGETDITITEPVADVKPIDKPAAPPRTKMYDDFQVMDIESAPGEVQAAPPVVAPLAPRPAAAVVQPPTRRSVTSPDTAGPRRPAAADVEPSRSIIDRPQPVASAPGRGPRSETGAEGEVTSTETTAKPETTSPPPTRKMPWGQVDVKPAEPEEKKFKWGERK